MTALEPICVRFKKLPHARGLDLPAYKSASAAGLDLRAAVEADLVLERGARALVPTGLQMELPEGCEAQIRPRSGIALEHGVTVLNTPGTIDSDYRGEIKVLLINHGDAPFRIARGDRIAQMTIAFVAQARIVKEERLSETERGEGGFGSTRTR